ncbi:hypothetical protein AB833_14775 [Chromatiales bacterium (ex Bugula neritina AB1)]|nr:hypothetical protein AB833_14775 [Chromatiales bacterium (ex Bugula neritina AB1)]
MLIITALSTSILCLLHIFLSFRVVNFRRKHKISVGDGGNQELLRAIRTQANLTEYAPLAMILLGCLELNGAPWFLCLLLAGAFVAGRILHPVGLKEDDALSVRVLAMQLTFVSIIAMAVFNILWLIWLLFSG